LFATTFAHIIEAMRYKLPMDSKTTGLWKFFYEF